MLPRLEGDFKRFEHNWIHQMKCWALSCPGGEYIPQLALQPVLQFVWNESMRTQWRQLLSPQGVQK